MINKKSKFLISAFISIIIAGFIVAITIHLLARFELIMLPKLIIPIIVIFFPTWGFVYYGMFKQKRK